MSAKKHKSKLKRKNSIAGAAFVSPWIAGFLVFTLYPLINGVVMSLNNVTIKPEGIIYTWAGDEFYDYALNVSTTFKLDLGSTAMMIGCSTPVVLVFSLIIAVLLNQHFPGRSFFRTVFFMPVIIMSGPVISSLLTGHTVDFTDEGSQIYIFLSGLPSVFSKPCLFVLDNLVLILWFSGVQILIFLAGLQKISPSLYEAADIDGASSWEKFWKITLPYVSPMVVLSAFYTIIELANDSTNSVNTYIAERMMDINGYYSFSTAMSWIYTVVLALLLLVLYLIFMFFGKKRSD